MSDIKAGDIVVLKSGGPKMTVSDVGDYFSTGKADGARCVWFAKVGSAQKNFEEVFSFDVLERSEPGGPPVGVFVGRSSRG